MKHFNRNSTPLSFRLMKYFWLFGFLIIMVLWVFQSFFLESFYTNSKKANVEKSVEIIAKSIEQNKNVIATIDNTASYNSLFVSVYNTTTSVFTVEYELNYANPSTNLELQPSQVYSYYSYALRNGGEYMDVYGDNLNEKAENLINSFVSDSPFYKTFAEEGWQRYNRSDAEIMVHCEIIELEDGSECFLVVESMITPVSTTIEIFRDQIFFISIVLFVLAIVISFYASGRIAKPISKTNTAAKQLAQKNYDIEFDAEGYLEVCELNQTLNYAKKELAATERLQKELIANISHDLRTPLTMITGYAEVMRDLPGENTPENVQVIIDEATRLSSLVTDLLDLSKIQSGSVKMEKSVFCLSDSIENIFSRYSKLKEQDGYNITFKKPDCKVYVNADELKVSQVIYNLVNNAINYVGEDKTVIVSQEINEKIVRINVTDHGDGIEADKLENIWERYYKVDKEHKRSVIGTGLGLSIVKSILDAHNAHYGVRSVLGKGSTFWFELEIHKIVEIQDDESEQ